MRVLSAVLIGSLLSGPIEIHAQPSTQATTRPTSVPSAFDPSRHMRVDEVRPGMKGYGLTVLSGTAITRFDVEVISILNDVFGPKQSVVMIRCKDEFMEHVGPIAGCSGSPIYLYDDTGNARLLGAYAYGYDLARDPIVGVQPIEYMLTLEKGKPQAFAGGESVSQWSLLKSDVFNALLGSAEKRSLLNGAPVPALSGKSAGAAGLRRLMTPLSVRGLSQSQLDQFAPLLRGSGFEPMLAMGGGKAQTVDAKLEPGSVMGASLLSGDLDLAAIGTCTEVIDGRVYGFGHPFMGEGSTLVPMGAGSVDLVMPVLTSSFKLGTVGALSGAIDMDGTYGIAGQIGARARMFPVEVEVVDESVGRTNTYQYQCAVHPLMSPTMVGMSLQASMTGRKELPRDHTIDYQAELKFEGGRSLTIRGVASSLTGDNVPQGVIWPAMMLANNPFERISLDGVHLRAVIRDKVDALELLSAHPDATSYKPGETVTLHLRLRPYRADVIDRSVQIELPEDLKDGDYSISVADAAANLQYEVQSRPGDFVMRSSDELFKAIESVVGQMKADRLFVRLSGTRQSLAIGRTSLERLPASKRAILEAAARPDTSAAVESTVRSIEMGGLVTGSADAVIHVARKLPHTGTGK